MPGRRWQFHIGPFNAADVTAFCMLTMIHSAVHVDAAAAQASGGLTVPTPLLLAALLTSAPVPVRLTACAEITREGRARCGEVLSADLELHDTRCTARITDANGHPVLHLRGTASKEG